MSRDAQANPPSRRTGIAAPKTALTLAYKNRVLRVYRSWLTDESQHGGPSLAAERIQAFKFME